MDQSLAGQAGQPFTMAVELGKIREFARATKSKNPAYEGQPGDRPVAPATFLASSAFWTTPDASPWKGVELDWRRILHGEQEYVFHGPPPRAGDVLTCQSRIDKVYEKEGKRGGTMSFAEVVTEYRGTSGAVVAEARSTLIVTSKATTEG